MKNTEKLLFDGYTVYLNNINENLIGVAVKYLGVKGTSTYEITREDIDYISKNFPLIIERLAGGSLLQIYMTFNHYYRVTLGHEIGEGPYGEVKAFEVIEDLCSYSLENALELLEQETAKIMRNKETRVLKRMYKLYGSDKYETYKEAI